MSLLLRVRWRGRGRRASVTVVIRLRRMAPLLIQYHVGGRRRSRMHAAIPYQVAVLRWTGSALFMVSSTWCGLEHVVEWKSQIHTSIPKQKGRPSGGRKYSTD